MDYNIQGNEGLKKTLGVSPLEGGGYLNYLIPLLFICSFFFFRWFMMLYVKYFSNRTTKPCQIISPYKVAEIKKLIKEYISIGNFNELHSLYKSQIYRSKNLFDDNCLFESIFNEINVYISKISRKDTTSYRIIENEVDYYINQMNLRNSYISLLNYNLQIEIYLKINKYMKAYQTFKEMRQITKPEISTYRLFFSYQKITPLQFSEIYSLFKLDKIDIDDKTKANIITLLSRTKGNNREIISVFESIEMKPNTSLDISIYNISMNAYFEKEEYDHCVGVFCLLHQNKIMCRKINLYTYLLLTKAYCMLHRFEDAKRIVKTIHNVFPSNITMDICNTISAMFFNANELDYALFILQEAETKLHLIPDLSTFALMMTIYLRKTNEEKIIELYDRMIIMNIKPNREIYKIMMNLFIKEKKIVQAIGMFIDLKFNEIEMSNELYSIIINACFINGYAEKAAEFIIEAEENGININVNDIRIGWDCYLNSINHSMAILENQPTLSEIARRYSLI